MTAHSITSPNQLFIRMIGGITLTAIGPIILVLVLIVHINIAGYKIAEFPRDVLTARLVAAAMIVTGIPIWFFYQRRLALGIRDGEWLDADLRLIDRIAAARSNYLIALAALFLYITGICLRGRFQWLAGSSILLFPIGAFHDLSRQFVARDGRTAAIETILQPAPYVK